MPHRVAAVDIGTNSVLLTIAESDGAGVRALEERATVTRLGQGVDRRRRLHPEALDRTLRCLVEYRNVIEAHRPLHTVAVCTSAARDARDGAAFLDEARKALQADPRIISGDEEARLTFDGALSGLDVFGPVVVCDVGGGSTEIIFGSRTPNATRRTRQCSLDVGSVRLYERHLAHDPPLSEELASVRADVRAALSGLAPPEAGTSFVGAAGTITTLAAVALGLGVYDSTRIHGARLSRVDIDALADRLAAASQAERECVPGLDPKRADVIVAGAALLCEVLTWAATDGLIVSDRGVRWGLVMETLRALQ